MAAVAPMFALAIIPVIGLVGMAVDYSRANSIKAALQASLDATALAMARLAPTLTAEQLQEKTSAYFTAQFNRPEAKNVSVTTAYTTTDGSTLTVTANGSVDTTFTRVMGYTSLSVGSSSTIKWGNQRLRVALVLDTTGSMASAGKIDAMKTATKNLIDQLKDRRDHQRRRLRLDRSVQPRRECRLGATRPRTGSTGRLGRRAVGHQAPTGRSNRDQSARAASCPFANSNHGFRCMGRADATARPTRARTFPRAAPTRAISARASTAAARSPRKRRCNYNGCYDSQPSTTVSYNTVCSGSGSCTCGSTGNCSCTGNGDSKVCTQTVTTVWSPTPTPGSQNARITWNGCVADRGTRDRARHAQNYDQKIVAPIAGTAASLFYRRSNTTTARPR